MTASRQARESCGWWRWTECTSTRRFPSVRSIASGPGQPVAVRLEAFPDLLLPGRVIAIGALARTTRQAFVESKRFDVTVELDPADVELRPEMTARVDIQVGERSDVVRLPVNALFERDGMTVVSVTRGGRVEVRQVELGEQNPRFAEVLAGVSEGERVMLVGEPLDASADATSAVAAGAAGMGLLPVPGASGHVELGPAR